MDGIPGLVIAVLLSANQSLHNIGFLLGFQAHSCPPPATLPHSHSTNCMHMILEVWEKNGCEERSMGPWLTVP